MVGGKRAERREKVKRKRKMEKLRKDWKKGGGAEGREK